MKGGGGEGVGEGGEGGGDRECTVISEDHDYRECEPYMYLDS